MRCRFAPSPTGDLHLGNARTALLAWLQARAAGGAFVLRVEDLDVGRVREEFRRSQPDDLRWMGLDWDEGPDVGGGFSPYLQSLRAELYQKALGRLSDLGKLYRCTCSRREILAAASAPHDGEEGPAYPGTCRERAIPPAEHSDSLRFRVPIEEVGFDDLIQGPQMFAPFRDTGDFVVRRKDGVAAYQLAVVVDDAAMKISHVLRGEDLLSSTARQILLYRALGLPEPVWAHVPLMLDSEGDRLAKRHESLTLRQVRGSGCAPERLVGWLAASCGLVEPDTEAMPADLVRLFDLERIRKLSAPWVIPPWISEVGGGGV